MTVANLKDSVASNLTLKDQVRFGRQTVTLGANLTLTKLSPTLQFIDPAGARDLTLPAESVSEGLFFIIVNQANAAEDITVKDDSPATIGIIGQNEVGILVCDGTDWQSMITGTGAGLAAADITITDTGTYYAAAEVEAALQELGATTGAAIIGSVDSGGYFAGATVEAILQELGATTGAAVIGLLDSGTSYAATDVEAALAELVSASNGQGASMIKIEDAGTFTAETEVEGVLAALYQHLFSVQSFIGIPLNTFRETSSFDVGAITVNGGILASDTTPVLDAINGATDGCQRLLWASSNNDQVVTAIPLPPDLDPAKDVVLHARIVSGGTTNAVGFTVDTFWNEADSKITDTTGTNQTTTHAEVTATIAAADIPAGAQTLTIGLTPVAHTNDSMAMTACWLEYSKALLTS